jgi:hypothetical protein
MLKHSNFHCCIFPPSPLLHAIDLQPARPANVLLSPVLPAMHSDGNQNGDDDGDSNSDGDAEGNHDGVGDGNGNGNSNSVGNGDSDGSSFGDGDGNGDHDGNSNCLNSRWRICT